MEFGRYSLPLTVAGLATITVASLLIWLMLNEPVALAGAFEHGDVTLVARAIGKALLAGFVQLARYL